MITVFDPLFKLDTNEVISVSDLTDTNIGEQVGIIAGSMGLNTVTGYTIGAGLPTTTLNAIDENLYNYGSKIIIPIMFETPSSGALGNTYTNANVAYLVISPKNATTEKTDTSASPHYSITDNGGAMIGDGTASGNNSADEVRFSALFKPDNITPSTDIKVAGIRLVNYRLYRSVKDDYPIVFDNVEILFYGYKTTTSSGDPAVTTIDEVVITSNSFSLSLVQQVLCVGNYNGQTFPILPTDNTNTVAISSIKPISSDTSATFAVDTVPFKRGSSDVGFAIAFLEGDSTNPIKCCHIYGKIYIGTN